MLGDVLAGPKSPRWCCSWAWAGIGLPERPVGIAGSLLLNASRMPHVQQQSDVKEWEVAPNSRVTTWAEFKRDLLAEVWSTINDACATSEPAPGRGSTVESDGGDGNGSGEAVR